MQEHYQQLNPIPGLNSVQLTPISFLKRVSDTFPDHDSIVYGNRRYSWSDTAQRAKRLSAGLKSLGITKGSTVAMMAANTPELMEAHYGIPMSGGVINAINTRLDADTVAYILDHGDAKVLITDTQFSPVIKKALALMTDPPVVVDIVDDQCDQIAGAGERLGELDYESLLNTADISEDWGFPDSEWDALSLNYTSGTSGRPKGVVYHHRGAYLMSMGTVAAWQLSRHPRYLYTVPLFHCNGWGHVWTMAIVSGTLICNRVIAADVIFNTIEKHHVTHFGAAPIILGMLANSPPEIQKTFDHQIEVMTAGAPPPSKVLEKTAQLGFNITHVYGLTETYGHVIYCEWRDAWKDMDYTGQAEMKARQGVRLPMMEEANVIDVETGIPVPHDGKSIGEIVLAGNPVMKGYYKNPEETAAAFKGGVFHSGDLAVIHPDGYMEVKDRLKDIIISGGENISSIEVESVLYQFPKTAAAAVVAKPDEKWGETPCAFIELKPGEEATEDEVIAFCKENMAGFKRPKHVVFMELPKTSTGKIQKFELRKLV